MALASASESEFQQRIRHLHERKWENGGQREELRERHSPVRADFASALGRNFAPPVAVHMGVTHLRRTRTAMQHRFAVGSSMIALIIVALLASGAGPGASLRKQAYAAVSTSSSPGERSVERAQGTPVERDGLRRTAVLRGTAPAVSRVQAPGGAAGSDGPRATHEAPPSLLELVTLRVASLGADVGRPHVPRPEQRTHSSRAPPIG